MKELTGPQVVFRSIAATLKRALDGVEPLFLDAGRHLSEAVTALDRLTADFAAMAARLEADDAMTALAEASRHIGALAGGTADQEAGLDVMHGRVTVLGARITRLRKTIAEISVLAMNAKVEAAHVTAGGLDFTVFTREIGRLAMLAEESLGRLGGELGGLSQGLEDARAALGTFGRSHRLSVAAVARRLDDGIETLANHRRQSAQAIRALADLSRRMTATIAQAVEGVQVGDISRQRGEHMVEALTTLAEVLEGSDMTPDHRDILVGSVCRLQTAQAEGAAAELRREMARIGNSLSGLAAAIGELPLRWRAIDGEDGKGGGVMVRLGRDVEDARQLLHRYGEARTQVDRVTVEVAGTVAGMVRHIEAVRTIEVDMRVMGLNATLKCGRLGSQGRALSVIAQELRACSGRTADDGRAIMADLHGMAEDSERLGGGGGPTSDIEADMAAAAAVLEDAGEEAARVLARLEAGCAQARQALDAALARLDCGLEGALVDCARAMAEYARAEAADEVSMDSVRGEVLELLRGRYTMASERKVHDLFGGPEDDEPAAACADDFLF